MAEAVPKAQHFAWHAACTSPDERRCVMQAFRNILFPADMSDSCTAAAPYVEALAKKFQSDVTLLHVLEMPPTYFTDWYGYMALADVGSIRDARQNEFQTYLRDRFQGLNV